jgi:hypothetical protein
LIEMVWYAGIPLSVANVAICDFFLDWRLKSAAGDFFGAQRFIIGFKKILYIDFVSYVCIIISHVHFSELQIRQAFSCPRPILLTGTYRSVSERWPSTTMLSSFSYRLRKLKLPTLAYRRKRGDMIETFKLTSGLYKYSDSQCCWKKYSDFGGGKKK